MARLRRGGRRRLGVEHLHLFGLTARGDAGADSDVDLFFEYERGALGLFQLTDVRERASAILGRRADVATRDGVRRALRRRIEAASVLVL
jgi:uncharacterized protein